MRRPDRFQAEAHISSNGAHLPATLNRLVAEAEQRSQSPDDVYAQVTSRIAELVPIAGVELDVDSVRQLLTLVAQEQSGTRLPASSLSDGTLRFLTLSVLASDPSEEGLMCIEEPENGIHPAKMEQMVTLLRDLSVDPYSQTGPDNPFRQVIVATHSPAFVQLQRPDDLLFAIEARVKGPDGKPAKTLRCRPLDGSWRSKSGERSVGLGTVLAYLSAPPNSQLELPELQVA